MLIMVAVAEGVLIQSILCITHFPNEFLGDGSGVRGESTHIFSIKSAIPAFRQHNNLERNVLKSWSQLPDLIKLTYFLLYFYYSVINN